MKAKQWVNLTNRDLDILQLIFEHRAVSHNQIVEKFFTQMHHSVAQKRLSKLAKNGYLKKSVTLYKGQQTLFYSTTEQGLKCFSENFRYEITDMDFKSDSVNHDIGLLDIRTYLESRRMFVDYLSESVLQNCKCFLESDKFRAFSILNSDAAIILKTDNNKYHVALEYEISHKHESRYAKKLTDYYFSSSVSAVFYICKDSQIEDLICRVDKEVGQKFEPKIFTCLEKHIQQGNQHLPFLNREKALFALA